MAAHREPNFVAVSRAGLTAAAALSLTRVFAGGWWLAPVMVAALCAPVVFTLGQRWRWPAWVSYAVTLVAGAYLAIVVDDPSELAAGLPTSTAFGSFASDLANAPHVLRSATVPVTPIGAALVLAVVATLLVALTTEAVARHLEAPLGAIGPSIALFVAIAALGSGRWAATTACYAIVVVAYLVALQFGEMAARRTWFHTRRARRSQFVIGGVLTGAAIVAFALVAGPALPGARSAAWLDYRSLGSGQGSNVLTATSPLVSVGAKLNGPQSNATVFVVRSADGRPYRWRVIALDQFQKGEWSLNADRRSASHLDGPNNDGATTRRVRQDVTIPAVPKLFEPSDPSRTLWLPAAYRPVGLDLHNASGANVLPSSTSLFLQGRPLDAVNTLTYTVDSQIATPTAQQLESVTLADLEAQQGATDLPPDFSHKAGTLAIAITKDASTPYEKALALQNYFQSGEFVYDQSVDLGASTHALDTFLTVKRGFCEQFATAYAAMARAVGLPTRVAVGYQPGELQADGSYRVSGKDAHAWPEVWMGERIGWYAFEPTPHHSDPVTHLGDPTSPPVTSNPTKTTPTTARTRVTTPPATKAGGTQPAPNKVSVGAPPSSHRHRRVNVVAILAGLLALAVLGAIAVVLALIIAARRRTHRRRHDPDPRERVIGAWSEALERLTAAGVDRRASATSIEFALRHAPAHGAGAAGPPLMDLARLHTAAMYAPEPPSVADADAAWTDVDAIDRALRDSVTVTDRWSARVRATRSHH